jgi:hypothetical protein
MAEFSYPVQILTKSTLVGRDLDLLERINRQSRALVCFSFSSVDERISRIYEPGVPTPAERLETLKGAKSCGIPCGLFLLPVIPFVTDAGKLLERALQAAVDTGVDYLVFGGMTLKEGRQSGYFLGHLARHHPDVLDQYRKIYRGNRWGQATGEYYRRLHERFLRIAADYDLPLRMPPELFGDLLDDRDRIVVILDQLDYLFRLRGKASNYGSAARRIAGLAVPIREQLHTGEPLPGINAKVRALIDEILSTGSAELYEKLLRKPRPAR